MKFVDYILGSRRGQDANALEKQSMTDPFLADAMEGFDGVYDNHHDILNDLSQKVAALAEKKTRTTTFAMRRLYLAAGIAAAVLVVVSALFITLPRKGVVENDGIAANLPPDSDGLSEGVVSSGITAMSVDENTSDVAVDVAEINVAGSEDLQSAADNNISIAIEDEITGVLYNSTKITGSSSDVSSDDAVADERPQAVSVRSANVVAENTESKSAAEDILAVQSESAFDSGSKDDTANNVRVIRNERFEKYFSANSRALRSAGGGQSGSFVVEFRVNDAGIPTSVRVVSGVSSEVNRKVIELLVSGPVWEPTSGERVRTVLKY